MLRPVRATPCLSRVCNDGKTTMMIMMMMMAVTSDNSDECDGLLLKNRRWVNIVADQRMHAVITV